jgi:hypothetical protein
MRENKGTTRSFRRAAVNAKKVFDSVRSTTETKADFPRQLAELQEELEKEKNSKYPNKERINRLEVAVKVKLTQVERYCGTDR